MKSMQKIAGWLCVCSFLCITGCSQKQTYEVVAIDDELTETSLKDWEIRNDTLYHKESGNQMVQVYQVEDGFLTMTDNKELLNVFEASFVEEPVYQDIHDETYTSTKAIRGIIVVSYDSPAPFDINIEPDMELKSFILSPSDQVSEDMTKALKEHDEFVVEGKLPVFAQPLHVNKKEEDKVYGVVFIPFYERICLVSDDVHYQVYHPIINHQENIDGLFVVVEKSNITS